MPMVKHTPHGRVSEINLLTATRWYRWPTQCFNFWLLRLPTWVVDLIHKIDLPLSFKRLNFLHTANFASIDRFGRFGQQRESRRRRWMVFCGNFNQEWTPYFEAFVDMLAGGVHTAWGAALEYPGYPEPGTRNALLVWLDARLPPTIHYYCAYPNASTNDIRAALRVNREVRSFAANEHPMYGPRATAQAFEQLLTGLQHCLVRRWAGPPSAVRQPPHVLLAPDDCTGMSGFVALVPILPDEAHAAREAIRALGDDLSNSPFQGVAGTHFARLALLEQSASGYKHIEPALRNTWLLFCADFDGHFDESEYSARRIKWREFAAYARRLDQCDALHEVWKHCHGYPGKGEAFGGWLWKGVAKRFVMYRDYPDTTLREICQALQTMDDVQALISDGRQPEGAALDAFLRSLRDPP